jgi:hypothetical protein
MANKRITTPALLYARGDLFRFVSCPILLLFIRFGVGVTCLLPGAVKDTSFASRSGVEQAACFHFPGYAKSAEVIAGEGVKVRVLFRSFKSFGS